MRAPKAAKRVKITTAYGRKAVRTKVGKKYALVFKGRKGDRVRIAAVTPPFDGRHGFEPIERRTLLGPKGHAITAASDGYATLKRSGKHRIRFTATSSRTQLLKLLTRRTTSKAVTVKARRGHQYAIDVTTGPGTRISTKGGMTGVRTGGAYVRHDGDDMWFTASTMTAVRGQNLLGADGYAPWEFHAEGFRVGATVRVYATPHRAVTVTPQPMVALSAAVGGAAVRVPRTAQGGAVVSLDTSTVAGPYATLLLDGVGGSVEARSVRGRELPPGGSNGQIAAVGSGDRIVVVVQPQAAGKAFSAVTTPVHPETLSVDGAPIRIPARADGLDTFVPISYGSDSEEPYAGLVDMSLTVHEAPEQRWSLVWGDPIKLTSPRGCNGCDEGIHHTSYKGTAWGHGRWFGSAQGFVVGTRNASGAGHFEVSMAYGVRP